RSRASGSAKDAKDAECRAELARLNPRNPQQIGTSAQQAALYRKAFRVLCVFRGQTAALDLRTHTSPPERSLECLAAVADRHGAPEALPSGTGQLGKPVQVSQVPDPAQWDGRRLPLGQRSALPCETG